ncbi:MAG: PocR ligand-binding domain-containing protein [Firmicutes bacterium]|nr:PocR ligand-binding domain-containing protein [Bacillota bacterium]
MDNLDLQWPLPSHIEGLLGATFEKQMIGSLYSMTHAIEKPIVFWYVKSDGEFHKYEVLTEYEKFSPVCSQLRHGNADFIAKCHMQDVKYAKLLRDNHPNGMPDGVEEKTYTTAEGHKITYGTYICKTTSFTEWIIPVIVEEQWLGVFMTGQFVDSANINDVKEKLDNLGLNKNLNELAEYIPKEENCKNFFNDIFNFIEFVKKQKDVLINLTMQYIQSAMQPYLRGFHYDEEHFVRVENRDPTKMYPGLITRFRKNRTQLFEAVILFKQRFNLEGIHVYKTSSTIEGIMSEKNIPGADLTLEPLPTGNEVLDPTRTFDTLPGRINLDKIKSKLEEPQMPDAGDKVIIEKVITEPNEIADLIILPDGENVNCYANAVLLAYANHGFESYPVVYVLFFKDEQTKAQYLDVCKNYRILSDTSALFLTNFNATFADYHYCINGLLNKFTNHELGNVLAGMKVELAKLEDMYQELAGANEARTRDLQMLYSIIDKSVLLLLSDYILGGHRYNDLLSVISGMTDSSLLTQEPKKRLLQPSRFLYNLCHTYEPMFRNASKQVKLEQSMLEKSKSVELNADSDLFQIIAHNLVNNALKYSYDNTTTFVEGEFVKNDEQVDFYRLTVTSYGIPMSEKECNDIFEMGHRSDWAEDVANGLGMGLFLVKKFAEKHGGTAYATSEYICDYHIAYLQSFFYRYPAVPDYFTEISDVKARKYREYYKEYISAHPNKHQRRLFKGNTAENARYIQHFINDSTAENVFVVEIPNPKEET